MSRPQQFRLPDLGEGLTEGEILTWLVAVGDTVALNQPIVEVETAKAAVEVPSPYAGVVTALHSAAGETVDVGTPIITVDTEPDGVALVEVSAQRVAAQQAAGAFANPAESVVAAALAGNAGLETELIPASLVANPPDDAAVEPGLIGGPAPGGRTSVLVGYGPRAGAVRRRPRRVGAGVAPAGDSVADRPVAHELAAADGAVADGAVADGPGAPPQVTVLAKPPVRKLARDLGVDLRGLVGTGSAGGITRQDVEAAVAGPGAGAAGAGSLDREQAAAPSISRAPSVGASPQPVEQRIPVKGVRKMTAQAMVASAFSAPHVTEFVTVDVTPSMELAARLRALPDFASVKVSPLLLVARALLVAARRHPLMNSSWDEAAQEIVVHPQVHLGIAAATPRGLVVPNIKDAGRLPLVELAAHLQALTDTARAGRATPADMAGGTITITNVGVFGIDTGTPILNPGEAAILALGAVRPQPWVHEDEIAVRRVTTLALSFDHRIVDGQLGSQFLADIAAMLADPATMLAWS